MNAVILAEITWAPMYDSLTVWLLGAGMLGSFGQALITFNRETWTRGNFVQTLLGGLGGVLLGSIPFVSDIKPWGQIVLALVVCYAAPDFIINSAKQIAAKVFGSKS